MMAASNVAISGWLSAQTGLPIDFQIQPQTHANEIMAKGPRNAVGLKMAYAMALLPAEK